MTTLFCSDTHLQHAKILTFGSRKFASIEEHDNTILQNILSTASKENILWHLGDVSVGGDLTEETIEKLKQIVAAYKRFHVVPGNHDTKPKLKRYAEIGIIVEPGMVEFKGEICLTHPPVHTQQLGGEGYEGRFKMNIHGHLHDHIITRLVERLPIPLDSLAPIMVEEKDHRYVNVSMEQINLTPVPYDVIKANARATGVF